MSGEPVELAPMVALPALAGCSVSWVTVMGSSGWGLSAGPALAVAVAVASGHSVMLQESRLMGRLQAG